MKAQAVLGDHSPCEESTLEISKRLRSLAMSSINVAAKALICTSTNTQTVQCPPELSVLNHKQTPPAPPSLGCHGGP